MRMTVSMIVRLIADGRTPEEIVADYKFLKLEDVRQALEYAAWLANEEVAPA